MTHSTGQQALQGTYRRYFDAANRVPFHGPGYCNFGYWTASTAVGQHGDHLIDRLVELLPETVHETILDVACGQGGTTKRLAARFPQSSTTGINLFEDQLAKARQLAPACTFVQMDATELAFSDGQFDLVTCVEAAFHFETREDFLKESWRVLKPGGHLLLTDILMTKASIGCPQANVVGLGKYRAIMQQIGFSEPTIISCLQQTWSQFRRRYVWAHARTGRWAAALHLARTFKLWNGVFADYILVCAQKPQDQGQTRSARPTPLK